MTHSSAARSCLILSLTLPLLFAGCAPTLPDLGVEIQENQRDAVVRATEAEAKGSLVTAAREYRELGNRSKSPQREAFLLKAASILVRGNYAAEARDVIKTINPKKLSKKQLEQRDLLLARIALLENKPQQALKQLPMAKVANHVQPEPPSLEVYQVRAEAYESNGNYLEAARTRIEMESLLSDEHARQENRSRIWNILMQVSPAALQTFRAAPPPDALSGWLELAYFAKTRDRGMPAQAFIADWQARYPGHPAAATAQFGNIVQATETISIGRAQNIALILPLSGDFAAYASAVRDGFLAAFYAGQQADYHPVIRVYDTNNDIQSGRAAYRRALDEGASFVVGPLSKPLLEDLHASNDFPVPTLGLNYTQDETATTNLYQFGLAPEDEARQVAERAWLDGYNKALVLIPEGEWGERMSATFSRHWQELGGEILESRNYSPNSNDFAEPVKNLLNIDASEARFRALKNIIGPRDIKFEPTRRQDADFIFVAAFPRQARLIRPQLKFHYAGTLPIYTTSHVFGGERNPALDRDMDGIVFPDIPWVLNKPEDRKPNWEEINRLWADSAPSYKRLYALGIDAYTLVTQLNSLQSHRETQIQGETGNLYLDDQNRIHRQLLWAQFKNGIPVLTSAQPGTDRAPNNVGNP